MLILPRSILEVLYPILWDVSKYSPILKNKNKKNQWFFGSFILFCDQSTLDLWSSKWVTCQCPYKLNTSSLICLFVFLSLLLCHHNSLHLTGKSWCIERGHWISWAVRVWEHWRGRVLVSHEGQSWHGCAKFSWGWAGLCNKKSLFWSSLIKIYPSRVKWLF